VARARTAWHELTVEETLDPATRRLRLPGGEIVLLSDTVGFVRRLPHQLVEAFASTLEETLAGDVILHVADASAPDDELEAQIRAVDDVLRQIGAEATPRILVLNKIDRCDEVARRRLRNRHPEAVQVSARTREGLVDLEDAVARHFAGRFERVELLVPHSEGRVLAELYALGSPIEREDGPDGVHVRAHLPHAVAERYRAFAVAGGEGSRAAHAARRTSA